MTAGEQAALEYLQGEVERLLAIAHAVAAVKAAQHGPHFWQCECGVLEDLDAAFDAWVSRRPGL